MYTAFYGLREKPFSLSPDPRFLYLSASHREALAHLLYGLEHGEGFIALTGEVGTGKTTLCRTLLERLGDETEVAFLFNPSGSATELLQSINAELGLPAEGLGRRALAAALNEFLLEKKAAGRQVLLVIDEAQNLSSATLEQIRLLSNLETSRAKLIQILMLGQPELDRKLDSRGLRQLRQRINVRWRLEPLGPRETAAYVRHRLSIVSEQPLDLFSDSALREIHRRTGGTPRLVNLLCDRTLLAAYAARTHRIGPRLVRAAAAEIPDTRRRDGAGVLPRLRHPWLWASAGTALVVAASVAGSSVDLETFAETWRARLRAASEPPPVASGLPDVASRPPETEVVDAPAPALGSAVGPIEAEIAPDALADDPLVLAMAPAPPDDPRRWTGESLDREIGRALSARTPTETRRESRDAALALFGIEPATELLDPTSGAVLQEQLEAVGVHVLPLATAALDVLQTLNHPVLIRLLAEDGRPRWALLVGLDDREAQLAGVFGGRVVRTPIDDLLSRWEGGGVVLWRAFEELPEVIQLGSTGAAVRWLQDSLASLGLYLGDVTGVFDEATRDGVSAFQRLHGLTVDGDAGPLTQMVLYDRLGTYPVPTLSARGTRSVARQGRRLTEMARSGALLGEDGAR